MKIRKVMKRHSIAGVERAPQSTATPVKRTSDPKTLEDLEREVTRVRQELRVAQGLVVGQKLIIDDLKTEVREAEETLQQQESKEKCNVEHLEDNVSFLRMQLDSADSMIDDLKSQMEVMQQQVQQQPDAMGASILKAGGKAMKATVMAPFAVTHAAGKAVVRGGKMGTKATHAAGKAVVRGGKIGTQAVVRTGKAITGTFVGPSQARTKWDDAIETIESMLMEGSEVHAVLTAERRTELVIVKSLLLDGLTNSHSDTSRAKAAKLHHLPMQLIKKTLQLGTGAVSLTLKPMDMSYKFIMSEYGGIHDEKELKNEPTSGVLELEKTSKISLQAELFYTPSEFTKLPRPIQKQLVKALSWSNLMRWDFNVFDVAELTGGNPLLFLGWAILGSPHSQFAMMEACEELKPGLLVEDMEGYSFLDSNLEIPPATLCNYLRVIEKDYDADNPYHNNIHAADVLQSLHSMIQMMDGFETNTVEIFSILLAAVVHDVNHPGMNNVFEIHTRSQSALLYNDISVLENRHASHAFFRMFGNDAPDPCAPSRKLFRRASANGKKGDQSSYKEDEHNANAPAHRKLFRRNSSEGKTGFSGLEENKNNILCNVSKDQFQSIRTMVVDAILHTDMSKHFQSVGSIKAVATSHQGEENSCSRIATLDDEDRWKTLMFMLHLADISAQAKPAPFFLDWTDRCFKEFFHQGDKEAELGLPISPNCDRKTVKIPASQVGFLAYVILPAYEALGLLLPTIAEDIVPIIKNNLQHWVIEKDKMETAESLNEPQDS